MPLKFLSEYTFFVDIMRLVGNMYKESTMLEGCWYFPRFRWSGKLLDRFFSAAVDTFLTLDASVPGFVCIEVNDTLF